METITNVSTPQLKEKLGSFAFTEMVKIFKDLILQVKLINFKTLPAYLGHPHGSNGCKVVLQLFRIYGVVEVLPFYCHVWVYVGTKFLFVSVKGKLGPYII